MIVDTLETSRSENGYNLSHEQVTQLTAELLEEHPPEGTGDFVCYKIDGTDRYADIGRKIECDVFNESFGNDPEEMAREYGPYEVQSEFFISIDRTEGVPTGVLRAIKNGDAGIKTLNDLQAHLGKDQFSIDRDLAQHGIDNLDDCWDMGTIAVPEEYRSRATGVSLLLYRGMHVASQEAGVKHYVMMADDGPYKKMKEFLGFPFVPLAGIDPMPYLGSEKSHPVYGYAPEFEKAVSRKKWTIKGFLARRAISVLTGERDDQLHHTVRNG